MAFSLVGTRGVANLTVANTANTPSWGTSENRTLNNLLILWVAGSLTGTTFPSTPAGWSVASQKAGASVCTASIFWKIATGADAAPTVGAIAGIVWSTALAEFTNTAYTSALDKAAGATSAAVSPVVATNGSVDNSSGDLILACASTVNSINALNTGSAHTFNNGASSNSQNNPASSRTNHYDFSYGFNTSNAAADSDSYVFLDDTADALAIASFQPVYKTLISTTHQSVPFQARPSSPA